MPWYIHSIRGIYSPHVHAQVKDSQYGFAVCEPYTAGRIQAAWWVLTGKAYAFEWPKAGDLEAAVGMPLWDRSTFKPTGTQAGKSR
jgi:hypothetical protein